MAPVPILPEESSTVSSGATRPRVIGPRPATTPCDPARTIPTTLHDALDEIAATVPGQRIHFPDEEETLRFADLGRRSRTAARALVRRGVRPGDRVGILSPTAPEFLVALFAVSRAGAAAAPLALPLGPDLADYAARLARVVTTSRMTHVVVSHRVADRLGPALAALGPTVLTTADLDGAPGALDALPEVGPDATAVVQFTSGSTADPKGVVLRHANVWHCARAITESIRLDADDVHGSWLPLFHDMGLFGALTALFRGIPVHLWSPGGFVRRPARWLAAFARAGVSISTMPNFGYDALLQAVPPADAAGYDLSRWRVAFNGAEAVSAAATTAFLERFAPAGFAPSTMVPAYGMAEVTLVATLPPSGRGPVVEHVDRAHLAATGEARPVDPDGPDARALVGLGHAVPGMRLRVVDPAGGGARRDGVVGEVQLDGPMTAAGYLGRPASDLRTPDGWVRTGDLGYLRDGELFFTGRLKEMITVAGRNVYPADVEEAARDVPGVHRGRCVALVDPGPGGTGEPAGPDGGERIAVVVETLAADAAARADLAHRVRERVAAVVGGPAPRVHPVSPRTIPRTTSGKVRRLEMRARLHQQESTRDEVDT